MLSGFFVMSSCTKESGEGPIITKTLTEAINDCHLVIGTSTRERGMSLPLLTAHESGKKIATEAIQSEVALVFGQESCGMSGEDLLHCNFHGYIPANPNYSSLNLAAAVQTFCYEIFQASEAERTQPSDQMFQYPESKEMHYFL